MYERFADRARKVVQLAKQSPPPTSPQPPGVVTRKPNYDAESMFWPRNCRKTSLVARRFPRGAGNSSWRPLGSVTAGAAKNLAGTGISAQILRCAQND